MAMSKTKCECRLGSFFKKKLFIFIESVPPTMYKCGFLCSVSLRIQLVDLSGTDGEWGREQGHWDDWKQRGRPD